MTNNTMKSVGKSTFYSNNSQGNNNQGCSYHQGYADTSLAQILIGL